MKPTTYDDKKQICLFCQKPIRSISGAGWGYGVKLDDEGESMEPYNTSFVRFDKLGFVCYAHRTCDDKIVKPFTKEIDERLYGASTDAKHDKVLDEWETVVASIIHVVRATHKGVSIRKIAEKLNVSTYFVRQVLNCLKQLNCAKPRN